MHVKLMRHACFTHNIDLICNNADKSSIYFGL